MKTTYYKNGYPKIPSGYRQVNRGKKRASDRFHYKSFRKWVLYSDPTGQCDDLIGTQISPSNTVIRRK